MRVPLLALLVAGLPGCEGCGSTAGRAAPSTSAASTALAPTSEPSPPTASSASRREAAREVVVDAPRLGTASVNGGNAKAPKDAAASYRHSASFAIRIAAASPGMRATFELVDRVAEQAEADDAHRILRLETTLGKEMNEGLLSLFVGGAPDAPGTPPRRARLVFGSDRVEVEVPPTHLPSRRTRSTATSLKNPILYGGRWSSLLFYAQASDDRGLAVKLVEPPTLELDGKSFAYPEWPEPGWVLRVRVKAR